MRGVGRHFGLFALETAMERAAHAVGMDPLDFRLRNLNETGALFDELTGEQPGLPFGRVGGQRQSLERAAELIGWRDTWHPAGAREVRPGVFHGMAIVSAIDRGGGKQGGTSKDGLPPPSTGQVLLHPDGTLEVRSGSTEVGAGQRTLLAMLAAQTTGIPLDQVRYRSRASTPPSTRTPGRRNSSLQMNVGRLGDRRGRQSEVRQRDPGASPAPDSRRSAAGLASGISWTIRDGWVIGARQRATAWRFASSWRDSTEPISRRQRSPPPADPSNRSPSGAHAVEIEVDTRHGCIDHHPLRRGPRRRASVLNRLMLEQQVEGGVAMGLGGALYEELLDRRADRSAAQHQHPRLQAAGFLRGAADRRRLRGGAAGATGRYGAWPSARLRRRRSARCWPTRCTTRRRLGDRSAADSGAGPRGSGRRIG